MMADFRLRWRHYSRLMRGSALALALSACVIAPPEPVKPTAPPKAISTTSAVVFEPAAWSAVQGWEGDSHAQAWGAFLNSCKALTQKDPWQPVCAQARQISSATPGAVRRFFEQHFSPYRVLQQDAGQTGAFSDQGMVTGYYEPVLEGARAPSSRFRTPLYAVPDDLLTVDLAQVYPELKGKRVRGRLENRQVLPYFTREQLSQSANTRLRALAWVEDPVDAFFFQVQGSGRIRLNAKDTVRLAYADQNGHPYQSIGRYLIEKGELTLANASAQGIRAWLRQNPKREQELLNVNPSVVFFREEKIEDPEVGPKGALGVPLTPGRSIAIDRRFLPLGAPLFLATTQPLSQAPLRRLVMGQDTGGAITGPLRADFFWGWGNEAGEQAGRMRQSGQIWLLWPKNAGPPTPQG